MVARCLSIILVLLMQATVLFGAEPETEVFPTAPFERYTIYQALVFFWIGIIGLIVIIAMKLKEIKRTRNMDIDKEDRDAPFLD